MGNVPAHLAHVLLLQDVNLLGGITLACHLLYDESATGCLTSGWSLHLIYYTSLSMLSHVGVGLLWSFMC